MKIKFISETELRTAFIFIGYCIIQNAVAQRGPCVDGKCPVINDACYNDQCYAIVGECDEQGLCNQTDAECVNTIERKNICIWLKTPKADDDVTESTITPVGPCEDQISNCAAYAFLCNDTIYQPLMTVLCSFTCGFCGSTTLTTVTPEICQDKAPPGKASDCTLYPELCYNPIYMKLMKEQCPKTCGYCDQITTTKSPACQDKEGPDGKSNCKEVKYLCNVPIYMPLILIQCPHTCGLC